LLRCDNSPRAIHDGTLRGQPVLQWLPQYRTMIAARALSKD